VEQRDAYVEILCRELEERKAYLGGRPVETLYFGGGTPSQLSSGNFERLFGTLAAAFPGLSPSEITLEANPDDITPEYLDALKPFPFNRISLGVQSLNDAELRFLNRRHDAASAIRAVRLCREKGFENISVDLMYGLSGQTLESWQSTLRQVLDWEVPHVSAYHLIYEEGTPLFRLLQQGRVRCIDEEVSLAMFETLMDTLTGAGFEHYEISNFARPGYSSRHNSGYWNGTHYLGVGASAHSYNGISRQWNRPASGVWYNTQDVELEMLDEKALFNDFIITRLRTMKGIDLQELETLFGEKRKACCLQQAHPHLSRRLLTLTNHHLRLTRQGLFVSDGIMADLLSDA
jgi:oxygen-independent coproporphyrinogen-3 oxidase